MSDRKGEAREESKEERQLVIAGWVELLLFVADWDGGMEGKREGEILTLMDACDASGWAEHSPPRHQHRSDFTARYFFLPATQLRANVDTTL